MDGALACLLILSRYHGIAADAAQLRHQFRAPGRPLDETGFLRAAKSPMALTRDRGRATGRRRPTVLVVDDDEGVRVSFEFLLEDHYEVVTAADGHAAMEVVRSRPVDCVLLDVLLPGKDGFQVLQEIVALDPTLPVIMVTAVNALRPGVSAMKLGAYDYLPKPFDEEELLQLIAGAVDWRRRQRLLSAGSGHEALSTVVRKRGMCDRPRMLLLGEDAGRRTSLAILLRQLGPVRTATSQCEIPPLVRWAPTLVIVDLGGKEEPDVLTFLSALRRRGVEARSLDTHVKEGEVTSEQRQAAGPHSVSRGRSHFDEIVAWVAAQVSALPGAQPRLSRRMSQVLEHVGTAYAGDCSNARLAGVAGLSPDYFARMFEEEVGLTPREFVKAVRVEIAKELLARTSHPTAAIARMTGFCDPSHLARVLRQETGHSPEMLRGKPPQ